MQPICPQQAAPTPRKVKEPGAQRDSGARSAAAAPQVAPCADAISLERPAVGWRIGQAAGFSPLEPSGVDVEDPCEDDDVSRYIGAFNCYRFAGRLPGTTRYSRCAHFSISWKRGSARRLSSIGSTLVSRSLQSLSAQAFASSA